MQKTLAGDHAQSATEQKWICVTCGQEASGNFCAHCGEKQLHDHDFSLGHVLAEAAEAFFHIDSKIFLTLKTLVARPGYLTTEFFLGRRKPYMSPLQTFFVCNLLFFLLQPLTGLEILAPSLRVFDNDNSMTRRLIDRRLEQKHLSRSNEQEFNEFSASFYHNAHLQAKSLILVLALMMAMVIALLNLQRRRYLSEHIIFCLHAYAWWLLWLLAILIVMAVLFVSSRLGGHQIGIRYIDAIATPLEFGGLGVYLFFAARGFYGDKLLPGIAKGMVVTVCGYALFNLYRYLLFFTVLYST
jgi:Protein of unknown function (DUF3667)